MIKIEIKADGVTYSVTNEKINAVVALDDLLNVLFMAKVDLEELQKAIIETAEKIKKDHKNETGNIPNPCSI